VTAAESEVTRPAPILTEDNEGYLAAAAQGNNFSDPIVINRSGPVNGGKPMYNWDKNNFQPRIAVAWSPDFKGGFLGKVFGTHSESSIRGGFGITNDYYGQAHRYPKAFRRQRLRHHSDLPEFPKRLSR